MNWTKESLKSKKATIDMKCIDEESFKWAVTRALNPIDKRSERVTKILREQSEKYNWEGLDFPTPLEQIETFEKNNNLFVNVFGFDEEKGCVETLKVFSESRVDRVLLMLIDDRYLVVKSVSRLLCGQFTKRHGKRFYCNNCLKGFPSEGKLNRHVESKCGTEQAEKPKVEQAEKPKVVCGFCSRQRRGVCTLHLDLGKLSGDRLVYVKMIRKEILNPERVRDIFSNCGGDTYKAVLKGDEWVYIYMGEREDIRIVSLDEEGGLVGVEHMCRACAVDKTNRKDCKCSMRDSDCDLCQRHGRDTCVLHTSSIDHNRSEHPPGFMELVLSNVGQPNPIVVDVFGERYGVVLKGGRWVHSYVGEATYDWDKIFAVNK